MAVVAAFGSFGIGAVATNTTEERVCIASNYEFEFEFKQAAAHLLKTRSSRLPLTPTRQCSLEWLR